MSIALEFLNQASLLKKTNEEPKTFFTFKEAVEHFHEQLDHKEMVECTKMLKHLKPKLSKDLLLNIYKPHQNF